MANLMTSSDEVLRLFNVTDDARRKFDRWSGGRRSHHVVPHVLAHTTEALYTLTPADVDRVGRTRDSRDHALGNVTRREGEQVQEIVDWDPDFAFTHVFHHALESLGDLPTWREFRRFCENDPVAAPALWEPAQSKIAQAGPRVGREAAHKAMRWRVGNAYYSSVREVHVITSLRAKGIDVRFHPLADALYRVDAWWEETVLSIYIGNDRFRNGRTGRKERPEDILAGGPRRFSFESINLKPADRYGVVHLAEEEDIQTVADRLRRGRTPV